MVLKRNRNWQKRSGRRKDNALDAEERHDEENQGNETQEIAVPKQVAKEEGFSDKDAEDFGVFTATRYAALWMEDRLAQKKEAEKKAKRKTDEKVDHGEENDDE